MGLVLFGASCAGPESTARKSFASKFSCPADRVALTKEHGRPYLPPPPLEIANDPERLAMYQHSNEVFWAARGCNEQAFYNCYRPVITEPAWQCDPIVPPQPRAAEPAKEN